MAETRVAVIGGTGLYEMEGLRNIREVYPETPFGAPSDSIVIGEMGSTSVAFLPRHGRGHRLTPTEIPARANIYALKCLGVERIISVSAVGSLREDMKPLDMVLPTQLIDMTKRRPDTFFEGGMVGHIGFADPFCPHLQGLLAMAVHNVGGTLHQRGTMVVIEGPAFSTRAESAIYRSWGADIIGMTGLPEAKLAREAEICYATIACVTDYDVWHPGHGDVTVEMVIQVLLKNVATSKQVLQQLIPALPTERHCTCSSALKNAIVTAKPYITDEAQQRLWPLVSKYMGK
ncbi:MAG: S-methyl-5'-thioadenosine phosphorylase [Dehalococcoidia bacterium]|nr:S-methyl-5'-thioadenosine phosphorylase [Dehalococcoidia bacterium]